MATTKRSAARPKGNLTAAVIAAGEVSKKPDPEHVRKVREIESRLRLLIDVHETAESFGDAATLRAGIEQKIAQIFAAALGSDPNKRRRLALVRRIDRLSASVETTRKEYVRDAMEGAYHGIRDEDLALVLQVWSTRPGAKRGGGVSKWRALSRVLVKHWGDRTKTETLEREDRAARRKSRNRGYGSPGFF
jgi:hypothetical protein